METVIMQRNALFIDHRSSSFAIRELLADPNVVKDSVYRRNEGEGEGVRVWWKEQTPCPYAQTVKA